MYAYKKSFLEKYCSHGFSDLEHQESLEQLRTLYMGESIQVKSVDLDLVGVDHPEDIEKVENIMRERKIL